MATALLSVVSLALAGEGRQEKQQKRREEMGKIAGGVDGGGRRGLGRRGRGFDRSVAEAMVAPSDFHVYLVVKGKRYKLAFENEIRKTERLLV